ncbi:hypothetical protein LTR09_002589 [Extremus antarcticus]|uniref:Uncharacterized protein n=1 Tax=Extremus antarcticus TaxID=702011 RepID=A0AAJ0GFZ6_9PEZI|nr:hypothetical protein LTR09_002589 [Extremus antarcticus]
MEAYPPVYPTTPQTETSHLRSSQYSNPAKATTRPLQQPDLPQTHWSAPTSQESFASYQSAASSTGPRLQTSSSNVSQLTSYTDIASPATSVPEQGGGMGNGVPTPRDSRMRTPEDGNTNGAVAEGYAVTSPMSVASPPTTNGTKRTASGHVKNAPSLPNTPLVGGRPRGDSTSSTNSKAGDLARDLRTRLGYAMAKVQNGWEHRNIHEVEQLAAHKVYGQRHSMSHMDYSRRPVSAGLTNGTAGGHPAYEDYTYARSTADNSTYPSKRHSGNYSSSYLPLSSQPTLSTHPRLQPAADIRPTTSYHNSLSQPPPASAMSPPRTPNGHSYSHSRPRPPTLRTETQTAEAERDALQALFQLGSPHTAQNGGRGHHYQHSQASSSQASPLRSEFGFPTTPAALSTLATPRRVTFARSESDSSAQMSADGSEDIEAGAVRGGEEGMWVR